MGSAFPSGQVFRFGLFEADVTSNTLTRNGMRVKIQDQPFRVLTLLLERPGEIVSREELRKLLWSDGTYVDFDNSLNVIFKKLRAAIDDDSENPRFIETVPRRGYRFIAPVSVGLASVETKTNSDRTSPGDQAGAIALPYASAPTAPLTANPDPAPSHPRHFRPDLKRAYAAAVIILVVVAITWFSLHKNQFLSRPYGLALEASARIPVRRSVAVLGFRNLSGRPEDAWLSTAFSEMLSTELAGGEKLRLVAGQEVANLRLSSSWPDADTLDHPTTERIGKALNSDLLILGFYSSVGKPERGELRLDVRLQDARTGEILTEIAQTGDRDQVFQIVAGAGAKLRSRLGVPQLGEHEQASVVASMPGNREAARFYALGISKLREFDALAAKDLLIQACKADPTFALSHAMLARAWSQLGYEQHRKEEAKKALDLSASLSKPDQMLVEGDYYESLADHERAASTYRALYQLFPDDLEYGLQLAYAESAAGHTNQASEVVSQLRHLPPPTPDDPRIDLLDARVGPTNDPARLVLIRSALHKAEEQGKKLVYARARKEECLNLGYSEHPEQGASACDEAYKIFIAAGDRLSAADSIRLMGDLKGTLGQYDEAIATYQRALTVLADLGEHYKTGAVLNNMAINFTNQGNLDQGERLYRQAKSHFDQAGDRSDSVVALANIGDIYYLRGNLKGATKLYQDSIQMIGSMDHPDRGYELSRLADVDLAQGRVQDGRQTAQKAIEEYREHRGGYQYLTGAMLTLGEALEVEGDLDGARQQFQQSLEIRQKAGELTLVAENQEELAELAIEESHPDRAESLIRVAIAQFEKEKIDPDLASAYTLLSRAMLSQGKAREAGQAIQHADELCRKSPDPGLKLPIAIQTARVEMVQAGASGAGSKSFEKVRQRLESAATKAKKLGYYGLEGEARLALGELEMKLISAPGRSQLATLAAEAHGRGLELLARKAEQAAANPDTTLALNRSSR